MKRKGDSVEATRPDFDWRSERSMEVGIHKRKQEKIAFLVEFLFSYFLL